MHILCFLIRLFQIMAPSTHPNPITHSSERYGGFHPKGFFGLSWSLEKWNMSPPIKFPCFWVKGQFLVPSSTEKFNRISSRIWGTTNKHLKNPRKHLKNPMSHENNKKPQKRKGSLPTIQLQMLLLLVVRELKPPSNQKWLVRAFGTGVSFTKPPWRFLVWLSTLGSENTFTLRHQQRSFCQAIPLSKRTPNIPLEQILGIPKSP